MNRKPKQKTITVRVPLELHEWLKRVGDMDRRKVGWVVRECVLNHIAVLERQYLGRGMPDTDRKSLIQLNDGMRK